MVGDTLCDEVGMTDWHLMQMADLTTGVNKTQERDILGELAVYGNERAGVIGGVYSHLGDCGGCSNSYKDYVSLFSKIKNVISSE